MSEFQRAADQMFEDNGFLGVPREGFAEAGRHQFIALLNEGLLPENRVLEIGCGVLRVAAWLVRFLDTDGYCGIEPHKGRVEWGRQGLLGTALETLKRPRFDHNETFDTDVFNDRFDFFLAGSIWTHCGKPSIEIMLDGFVRNTNPGAVFLASIVEAHSADEDYQGRDWVGTSHRSTAAGIVRHDLNWIAKACQDRGLILSKPAYPAFDGQKWLKITRNS